MTVFSRYRHRVAAQPGRWAGAVVVVLLIATASVTVYTVRVARQDTQDRLVREADAARSAIGQRLAAYSEVLVAVRGLFETEPDPSRARFRQFVRSLQVEARYPGIKVLSFAGTVEAFEREQVERAVRRDAAASGSAYPRFSLRADNGATHQVAISYMEPVEGNEPAFGFDLLSESRRREAVMRTQRTGQAAATAPLTLLQARDAKPGFVLMLAVRGVSGPLNSPLTGRFRGVVSAAFDYQEMLSNVVDNGGGRRDFDLEVFDVGAVDGPRRPLSRAGLTFDIDGRPDGFPATARRDALVRELDVGGRRWAIYYALRATRGNSTPWIVAATGALASLLAGWLVLTLARGRAFATALATRMTADLEASTEELSRANAVLAEAQQLARLGSWECDITTGEVRCSPELQRIYGTTTGAEVGGPDAYMAHAHPDDRTLVADSIEASLQSGKPFSFDHRIVRPDGEVRFVHGSGEIVPGPDGRPLRIVGTCQDVTERRRADEELREAQERFAVAFESAPIGMALTTPDGRYLRVNDALCAITGYPREALEQMSVWTITHPDNLEPDREQLRKLVDGEIALYATEKRYMRPDGTTTWASVVSTVIRDSDGEPSYLLAQIQDISERRLLEQELRQLAHHDPLTGLPNRRAFEEALARHLALARRYGPSGALLLIDLDRFKLVNDEHGHLMGDRVLVATAAALRGRVRGADMVARLGGDEFAVLLARATREEARLVAGALAEAIARATAIETGRTVAASIGLAVVDQASELTADVLFARADAAMYDAKHTGREGDRVRERT